MPVTMERSREVLNNVHWQDPGAKPAEQAISCGDIARLLDPGYLPFEDGYSRFDDGTIHVAVLTPLPGCSGEMFEWWFSQCDDTEIYQLWHPNDHEECKWDAGFYNRPREERVAGHYVGHSHIVREKIGGKSMHLHIDFTDPTMAFDTSRFQEVGVTACLVARSHIYDALAGDVAVGHLVHMVRESAGGVCELRSRFWLGQIESHGGGWLPKTLVDYIGNTKVGRYLRAPSSFGRDLHKHCREEMSVLAGILPELWKQRQRQHGEDESQDERSGLGADVH